MQPRVLIADFCTEAFIDLDAFGGSSLGTVGCSRQVHHMKDQRHDFCVSEKLSAMLAEKCASIMTITSKAQGTD